MIKESLGKIVRKYRKELGWTQEKTALEADVSFRFLQEVEGGKQLPSLTIIFKLCKALKITPDKLILPVWSLWLKSASKAKK